MRHIPRSALTVGVACMLCALSLALLLPVWHQKKAASDRLHTLQRQTDAVIAQSEALISLAQSSRKTPAETGGTLFSEVDGIVVDLGIRSAVASIKPSDSNENGTAYERVAITAIGLYQQKGVAFLHALEKSGRGIQVEHCAIRRSKENLWDMTLTARRPSGQILSRKP